MTIVTQGDASNVEENFPTITFCLNSMHAESKIREYHNHTGNETGNAFISSLGMLYGFFYDTHQSDFKDIITEIKQHGKKPEVKPEMN